MSNAPHWTAYVSAIALPAIALIAAWIAFRQSQIARNKLKLDLFDKRMVVYEVVRKTLGTASSRGSLTPEEEISYVLGIRSAQWLFGPEVFKHLNKTLLHRLIDLHQHNSQAQSSHKSTHAFGVKSKAQTLEWLTNQYTEVDKLFSPYLLLRH